MNTSIYRILKYVGFCNSLIPRMFFLNLSMVISSTLLISVVYYISSPQEDHQDEDLRFLGCFGPQTCWTVYIGQGFEELVFRSSPGFRVICPSNFTPLYVFDNYA